MVKSLEGIPSIGKLKIAVTARDRHILYLDHDLIFILDSDISSDGSAVISQSHLESNILTWGSRIGIYVQVFDVKGTNSPVAQSPSTICSSSTEFLCQVDQPPGVFDIRFHGETVIGTGKPIVRRRKINSILAGRDIDIPCFTYNLISVFDQQG